MAAPIVPYGYYRGKTLAQLEREYAELDALRSSLNNAIASASYNGDSFTYNKPRQEVLESRLEELAAAFAMLGDNRFGPLQTNQGAIRLW